MTMDELWKIARQYGRVILFTSDSGTYSCDIHFHTIEHTKLEAKSGYGNVTPNEALINAIKSAEKIVLSFNTLQKEDLLKLK